MSNKKTLTISILAMLTVLVLIVAIIFFSLNRKEKELAENMNMIKSNYASFISNITDNDQIRQKLIDHVKEFDTVPYEDEIGKYEDTLKKYDKNIKYLDSLVKDMENRCKHKYEDQNIRLLCQGYDGLYESTVNKYILNVTKFNNKITEYNNKESKSYETHELIYKEFIDYNKDGKFAGSN